jgi:hypothetical protein
MKKLLMILVILAPLAGAEKPLPSDEEMGLTLAHTMEVARRINANGMSYQMLKRCGANPDLLKKTKRYLYQDIAKTQRQNPEANVDVDGLFEYAAAAGNEYYETAKANPKLCPAMLEEANKYITQ